MRNHSRFSVSNAGDVNGDGLDDLIIGAHNAGKSYVVFGSCLPNTTYDLASLVPTIKSSKPSPLTSPALETECTGGFVISGESMRNHSRFSVSSAGDVNGDGLDDLIIGAHNAGKSYVVFGKQDTAAINLSVR
jgi:hypothetical protein